MNAIPVDALDRIVWEDTILIEIRLTSAGVELTMSADLSGVLPLPEEEAFGYFVMSFLGVDKLDMPLRFAHFVPADYPRDELPDLGGIHALSIVTLPESVERFPPRSRLQLDWDYGAIRFAYETVCVTTVAERIEG